MIEVRLFLCGNESKSDRYRKIWRNGRQCRVMVKLPVRAEFWRRASLGLAVALLALMTAPAGGQDLPAWAMLGMGSHKNQPLPGPPPIRASQPPTLSYPVEPMGFSAPGAFYLGMRNSLVSLDFLDEDKVLFTFRVPGLIHRDLNSEERTDERKIRALVIRLPQGTVQAEAVWTVHDRSRYLWMLGNGQFLFRDREKLQLGDASLQLKPYLQFPGPVLWVEMDPSKKYLVTGSSEPAARTPKPGDVPSPETAQATVTGEQKLGGEPDMVLRILRRDSGQVLLVSHLRSEVHLPINGDGYLETLRSRGAAWALNLNFFTGGSSIVGSVDSVCSPSIDFVSAKEFLATTCGPGGDARLVAMGTNGHRLWEGPASGRLVWPLLVMAADGSRLARETLVATHAVNASAPLGTEDIKGQAVEVIDAASGKVALRAEASPVLDAGGNVAISPSGRRVAVLGAGAIQIFELPAPPPLPDLSVTKAGP